MGRMSKAATIASLVRVAAKTEAEFVQTVEQVLDEGDADVRPSSSTG